MNEFSLIEVFFKNPAARRSDVVFGIGDDAACVEVPAGYQLLISMDTLTAEVHFKSDWDAYDIAWKAVMVNISDIAAMGGEPCWITLALTLPDADEGWIKRFSQGLHAALARYNLTLIGGDTTKGPLSITLTVHGLIPSGLAVTRSGAKPGDKIWVSGTLGAAALAVSFLGDGKNPEAGDLAIMMNKLLRPVPRVDLAEILRTFAVAAIDISDGLAADLNHICTASKTGACLNRESIPVHPCVKKYRSDDAVELALHGGDDYELCFIIAAEQEKAFISMLKSSRISSTCIGRIEETPGLRMMNKTGKVSTLDPRGYSHF